MKRSLDYLRKNRNERDGFVVDTDEGEDCGDVAGFGGDFHVLLGFSGSMRLCSGQTLSFA